jgi:glycosyltransferase involved in cell wall biosynthesis
MRIVIDMQGAQTESRFRGIGRYSLSFAQAIVRNRGEHEIFLALSGLFPETIESIRTAFDGLLPQENIRVWSAPGPVSEVDTENNARRKVAELIREAFLASLQPDVIHVSSLFEGYGDDAVTSIGRFDRSTPVSVSLYDLIPLLNSDHYLENNPSYAKYYWCKVDHLKQASVLLSISEYSRYEGLVHLGVQDSRIVNVSTAIEANFRPLQINDDTTAELRSKFGLVRPWVMYTGGADERKNLPRLIQAYSALPAPLRAGHQLLLAGKISQGDLARLQYLAKSTGLKQDELCFIGYVTDKELIQLYNLCKLFIFPSWHEGFGLPALEAMACGAPVIGANTSSLPEVINLEVALFDPLDVNSIATKMSQALKDEAFRSTLREHGLQQAKQFSWDETARRAISAWESLQKSKSQKNSARQPIGRKPSLAFVSPLPPERTGIADYSAELLPALAAYYDIELVVAQDRLDANLANGHPNHVHDVTWLRDHASEIDRVLYHVGNSPFHQHMLPLLSEIPGSVMLHDFYLSGLMAWLETRETGVFPWVEAIYASHGYGAVRESFTDPEAAKRRYPVNLHILQHAQGLIFHSEYSMKLTRQWYGNDFAATSVVVPLLRSPAQVLDKAAARKQLGINAADFVVCSFGFLDETKLNHRLLASWLSSALAGEKHCHLIFVGENHGGDYGASLMQTILASGFKERILITGFASPEKFRNYLVAADMAVQLRSHSRGETSAAVLDCMNYALPLIVNANGSMDELNHEAVWVLPDEFDDDSLVNALETLWGKSELRSAMGSRASDIILRDHAPAKCARLYADAIEGFHSQAATALPSLIQAIAAQYEGKTTDAELIQLSQNIAVSLPIQLPGKSLFLDITATCRNDLKTGIERVARALTLALLDAPPPGYRIEPVYLCDAGGFWHYRYARRYTLGLLGCPPEVLDDEIVEPVNGDVMLGLDLSGDMLVQADRSGLFTVYRNRGVAVHFLVYDLLPARMPDMFPPGADQIYARWLQTVAKFDGAICISNAVADDLAAWQVEIGLDWKDRRSSQIGWFHLGADMASSAPSRGLTNEVNGILRQLQACPSFLMVGTIEPRKGYLQTLEAFSQLWSEGVDVNLVIVGNEGWKNLSQDLRRTIPEIVKKLRIHPELGKHLFWLEGISDEYLDRVYGVSTCLIAASEGEGFGLPLIEAAQHKLPIIARDITVFREVAGESAYYFSSREPKALADAVINWLKLDAEKKVLYSLGMSWLTWKESAKNLKNVLFDRKKNQLDADFD